MGQREEEAIRVLNQIEDPCSIGSGVPIGLEEMGLVREIEIAGERVSVSIEPTFPGCLFIGLFRKEALERLERLEWCNEVEVKCVVSDQPWDESRIKPQARRRLERARAAQLPKARV